MSMERDAPEPAVLRSLRARLEMDAGLGAEYFADPGGELLRAVEALTKAAPAAPAGRKETAAPRREFVAAPVPASAPAVSAVSAAGLPAGHVSLVPLEAAPGNPSKEALLADLRRESGTCALCGLCERRSSVVWGEGSLDADILFIGEGPGRDEDIEGRPFVGRSGRLLTDIIEKGMRRPRSSVYIANVVKCRPPGNRDPRPEEVAACSRYLNKQIEVVRPAVIVAVGMVAGRALLGLPPGTGGLRGVWHSHEGIPLRVIYHPSYLLRQRDAEGGGRTKADKATWDDMLAVMEKAAR
jgi:DNA polymerase